MSERSTDKIRKASDKLGAAMQNLILVETTQAKVSDECRTETLHVYQDALNDYGLAIVATLLDLIQYVEPGSKIPTPEEPQAFVAKKISFV